VADVRHLGREKDFKMINSNGRTRPAMKKLESSTKCRTFYGSI